MADYVLNNALGQVGYYATLPAANDAFIIVLLKSAGLEADTALRDYTDLASLLAATNDECTFTNYARKTVTSVTVTTDNTNDRKDIDIADQTWTAAGGASNDTIGALLVCYDPDTTTGTDSTIVPLMKFDFSATTNGTDLTAQINAVGLARITS